MGANLSSSVIFTYRELIAGDSDPARKAGGSPPSRGGPGAGIAKPLILVVEDDVETRDFVRLLLELRYRVITASGAAQMREMVGSHDFSLVLMDVALREAEDGIDLARWIRSNPSFAEVPIIATTAYASADVRAKAMAAGCTAYLAKPFSANELYRKIEECLQLRA